MHASQGPGVFRTAVGSLDQVGQIFQRHALEIAAELADVGSLVGVFAGFAILPFAEYRIDEQPQVLRERVSLSVADDLQLVVVQTIERDRVEELNRMISCIIPTYWVMG